MRPAGPGDGADVIPGHRAKTTQVGDVRIGKVPPMVLNAWEKLQRWWRTERTRLSSFTLFWHDEHATKKQRGEEECVFVMEVSLEDRNKRGFDPSNVIYV